MSSCLQSKKKKTKSIQGFGLLLCCNVTLQRNMISSLSYQATSVLLEDHLVPK